MNRIALRTERFPQSLLYIWEGLLELLKQFPGELIAAITGYGFDWLRKKMIQLFNKKPVLLPELDNPDRPLIDEHLRMIEQLYLHPFFTIDKESRILIDCFYDVSVDVTRKWSVNAKLQPYFISNFFNGLSSREQLVKRFIHEKRMPTRNDSRYMMGFRSLWFVLRENRDKLSADYTAQIISKLEPFFSNFMYKQYLQ